MARKLMFIIMLFTTCLFGFSAGVSFVKAFPVTNIDKEVKNELFQVTDSMSLYYGPGYLENKYYVLVVNYWEGYQPNVSLKNRMEINFIPKDDLSNSYWGRYVWHKNKVRKYGYCKINGITVLLVDVVSGTSYFETDSRRSPLRFILKSFPKGSMVFVMDGIFTFSYENKKEGLLLIYDGYPETQVIRNRN